MGNSYCTVCKVQLSSRGNMCTRCYNKEHPRCSHCGADIYPGDNICGLHKICYYEKNQKCYKCHRSVANSPGNSYCTSCYDSMNPPPLVLRVSQGDSEVSIYSRHDAKDLISRLGYLIDGRKGNGGLEALDMEKPFY